MSVLPRESEVAIAQFPQIVHKDRVSISSLVLCVTLVSIIWASAMLACFLLVPGNLLTILTYLLSIAIGTFLLSYCFVRFYKKWSFFQKIESHPSSRLPQLSACLLNDLQKSTFSHLSHTHEDSFFTNFLEWKETFLRDPKFLLNSALASWHINPSESSDFPELYRDYTKFSLILTSNSMEATSANLCQESHCCIHQISKHIIGKHQISQDSKVVRSTLQSTPYILPVLPEISLDFSTTELAQRSLYQIFRNHFTRYYLALNHTISQENLIILRPLASQYNYPIVRQMEWLALLCAIEQLRFTPMFSKRSHTMPTDATQTPVYPLSPKDYWSIFVHRDLFSFNRDASYFGLIDHPSTSSPSMSFININRARYMNTHHIVLSDISPEEIKELTKFSTRRPRPN